MNKINFFVPLQICKSEDGSYSGEMELEGIASTSHKDSDGEELDPSGYNLEPFLTNGIVNWNHKSKDDPSAVVGEPVIAKITPKNELYVKVKLFSDSRKAKKVYELAEILEKNSSTRKLGFSIEGVPIERDFYNSKRILKANITGLAITPTPKNRNTFASIIKGEYSDPFIDEEYEDEEEIEKVMSSTSVAPLIEESLEGSENKKLKKSQIYSLISKSLSSQDPGVLLKVYNFMEKKKLTSSTEEIEKALELLEVTLGAVKEDTIQKGEEPKSKDGGEDEEEIEVEATEEVTEEPKGEIKKSEETVIEKGCDNEEIEKAALNAWTNDSTTESIATILIRRGYSLSESMGAAAKVVADMENNKQGGDITKMPEASSSISKAEFSQFKEELFGEIEKSFGNKMSTFVEAFKNVSTSMASRIDNLTEDLEIQKSENEILSRKLREPIQRKSVTSYRERFDEKIEKGETDGFDSKFNVGTKEGRLKLADAILEKNEEFIVKGQKFDEDLLKIIPSLEISGSYLDPKTMRKIEMLFN